MTTHTARGAAAIHAEFRALFAEFDEITRRSRARFEARDWHGCEADIVERLDLYPRVVERTIRHMSALLGERLYDVASWEAIREDYAAAADRHEKPEIARTFFNSVTRRVFDTDGVNPRIEFTSIDTRLVDREPHEDLYLRYAADSPGGATAVAALSPADDDASSPTRDGPSAVAIDSGGALDIIRAILDDRRFSVEWYDRDGDAAEVSRRLENHLEGAWGGATLEWIDIVRPVFYRVKHAYIVGRARAGGRYFPFILPLLHGDHGVHVDAVLLTEDEASILFSFTRAYFHVHIQNPSELVLFLRSILPRKPAAELYLSIGFHKHGKTELFRRLARHLESSDDRFRIAEGERGMVMLVFTLPSYDMVFKIIRDRFAYPKTMTAQQVKRRYRLVFERDRVGRLVEAQTFEHLQFPRDRFEPALLDELLDQAGQSVRIDDETVTIDFLYTERRVRPLNLYLREVGAEAARAAVLDYGRAIKELAAANIFPGDFLPKNFGVTRHGRVVFYDYDELCLLTECNFRALPVARSLEDELASEPWFSVEPNDIFPEEFVKFLGIPPAHLPAFLDAHGDLLGPDFWRGLQERLRSGEVVDVYPYPTDRRLLRTPDGSARPAAPTASEGPAASE